ncbi:MAG: hypothetical protein ACOC90_05075 [Bacteroidota bacterium]
MIFFHIEKDLHDIQKIPYGQGKKIVQGQRNIAQSERNTAQIEKRTLAIQKKYPQSYPEISHNPLLNTRQIETNIVKREKSI